MPDIMKKKKLKLSDLTVQSFVTEMNEGEKNTIAGGHHSNNPSCHSDVPACQNTVANVCVFIRTLIVDDHNICF